ncbi:MAG: methylenetetrahydrofolate reductase [NAD(P)H] [Phycisphaerales bacterium]
MHINDIFAQHSTTFSFEFFPPKTTEAAEALYTSMTELESLKPSFVSVTYGAGGSTRELTRDLVVRLKNETRLDPVPHLTCVCHKEPEIRAILERYAEAGISNILALGGDVPKNLAGWDRGQDAFRYASDLVAFIRTFNAERRHQDPRGFGICVAGYPEGHPSTPNRVKEMDNLKAKVDAGADWICTQLFFDNHDFLDFRDRCEVAGIRIPIIAGIMPVTSMKGLLGMSEMALGCRFPGPLLRRLNRTGGDPDAMRRVGIQWATQQCEDLLENRVRGIHFYTLNRSTATREIFLNLGVKDTLSLLHPPRT